MSQFRNLAILGYTPLNYLSKSSRAMLRSKPKKEPSPVDNSVSDSTGQYDLRFVLWRQFCALNNIPVDTLPSQLNENQKELGDAMKQKRLR